MMKTDKQLQQDVTAELSWDPAINSAEIGVAVKDGVVTLSGQVGTYAEKIEAEHAAVRVFGVKALAVEMEVELAGHSTRTDSEVARSVENVLEWTTCMPKNAVKVMVENGIVTLSGDVHFQYQRQAAVGAICGLFGVKGVNDEILIKPAASATIVKADIEAALKRRAKSEINNISVSVQGHGVTLSGKAHSWSERELAASTAWASPGVHSVVDNITLTA
jgi:osmotically-inducible protein OsmY